VSAFELQPTLEGPTLLLRPLRADDFEALYAVASDPLIWEQHPRSDRWKRPVFEDFFAKALASGGAFAVVEKASGAIVGSTRYYDLSAASVAIGFTFLARRLWGGAANREMKELLLAHAFGFVPEAVFHVGENNRRSRRALEKIGARLAGTREDRKPDGSPETTAIYAIRR
jgi:N-acetyltransferase